MEMIENAVYSSTQISTAPQTQRDCKPRENDSLRCPVSCFVVIPLGFLAAVLLSLLIYNWSLYNDSSCPSCPSCPDFWMRHQSNCYYFSTERKIWDLGLEFCKASKSTLIMLTDSKEMELLKDFCSRDYYWIGLKNDSGWRWLDGSVLNSSSYLFRQKGTICSGTQNAVSSEPEVKQETLRFQQFQSKPPRDCGQKPYQTTVKAEKSNSRNVKGCEFYPVASKEEKKKCEETEVARNRQETQKEGWEDSIMVMQKTLLPEASNSFVQSPVPPKVSISH